MVTNAPRHVVVVPVKPPVVGKSRLLGVPDDQRTALAAAFATDTVGACLETPGVARVLVTTDDARFAAALGGLGADTCPDGATGLNEALVQAVAEARRQWPALLPVALCADLPALRPADLAAALDAAGGRSAYVADVEGTGTTLYTAPHDDFRAAVRRRLGRRPCRRRRHRPARRPARAAPRRGRPRHAGRCGRGGRRPGDAGPALPAPRRPARTGAGNARRAALLRRAARR
ncbi:hypothetical protein [Nocardioides sp. TF02-7]|uniref:hypothetical protein n=1 Tax=Nocardioides sp. TF02-7 TaxID=2917724 RepID=UPI001F058BCE|nr:hypothetical protein [Nocardioides sp. TF02-7]UMG93078.1 hypothetical protein MF408_01690 [Nocardioides sp. TF02-7]